MVMKRFVPLAMSAALLSSPLVMAERDPALRHRDGAGRGTCRNEADAPSRVNSSRDARRHDYGGI